MLDSFIIGEIVSVHGVKGGLKVNPSTDDVTRFKRLKTVKITVKGKSSVYSVKSAQMNGNTVILNVEGIETRDQAELMRGGILEVDRKDAIKLPENTYFIGDLIGCSVFEENGNCLGAVDDVLATGSNDVYSVTDKEGHNIMIPALSDVILSVDVENAVIKVKLPAGLKEIYLC